MRNSSQPPQMPPNKLIYHPRATKVFIVRFRWQGIWYYQSFPFDDFVHGKEGAFAAAQLWRDRMLERLGKPACERRAVIRRGGLKKVSAHIDGCGYLTYVAPEPGRYTTIYVHGTGLSSFKQALRIREHFEIRAYGQVLPRSKDTARMVANGHR